MIAPIKGQTMSSAQAVAMRDRSAFFAEWAMGCGHDGSDLRQEHGQYRCSECDVPLRRRKPCVGR